MTETRSLCVTVSGSVKAKLIARSRRLRMSLNDTAVALLAEQFGKEFKPSGRPSSPEPSPDKLVLLLRIPPDLLEAIRTVAFRRRTNMTHEVNLALAEELRVRLRLESRRSLPLGGGPRRYRM